MGRPKAALPFGDVTILDRLIAELSPAFAELIVVAAPREVTHDAVGAILARWNERITVLYDHYAFAGPVPALLRGLRAARHATAFVCSCDIPLLRAPVAQVLCSMLDGFDGAIPLIAGKDQPLCAAYECSVTDQIDVMAQAGEARLTKITSQLAVRVVTEDELRLCDPELRSFLNVNTPADYLRALALARF
jgi:molybdenum cofactor guanylyltransferase